MQAVPANYLNNFQSTDPALSTIITDAYFTSPLVNIALTQEHLYRQQVYFDQENLLSLNRTLWSGMEHHDIPSLQKTVLERIDRDKQYALNLKEILRPFPPEEVPGALTWSLKSQKMGEVLTGASAILQDETAFSAILMGHAPHGYENRPLGPAIISDPMTPYGSHDITFLNAAIVEVNLALLGPNSKVQDIPLGSSDSASWIDHAALLHVTAIPDYIDITKVDAHFVENGSFYFSDEITPQGFSFVHTGYAFGGQRGETRYAEHKEWGPEDCSSWLAKLVGTDLAFSTMDQLFTYRLSLPEESRGYISEEWLASDRVAPMQAAFTPVHVQDPFQDIHAGQIVAMRSFSDANHADSVGSEGHTLLVLGVRDSGDVVCLGYRRQDMPKPGEGFGIQEFHYASTEKTEMMFFNVNNPLSMADILVETEALFPGDASPLQIDHVSSALAMPVLHTPILPQESVIHHEQMI